MNYPPKNVCIDKYGTCEDEKCDCHRDDMEHDGGTPEYRLSIEIIDENTGEIVCKMSDALFAHDREQHVQQLNKLIKFFRNEMKQRHESIYYPPKHE